jgi:uncharacterized membrane protein
MDDSGTTRSRDTGLRRPIAGGLLLGLGLGGFFDGIVLHQILQWHHMLTSAGYPADTLGNLELNVVADGFFHAATWILSITGLLLLWSSARRRHLRWPAKLLAGGLLLGWGLFNLVEGIVDHHLLGIHHVRPGEAELLWDVGFLAWGAAMALAGWHVLKRGRQEVARLVERQERPRAAEPAPGRRSQGRQAA